MSSYRIKRGIAVVADHDSDLFIVDERGRKKIKSPLVWALLDLIHRGIGDEDRLVTMVKERFRPEEVYYALIQLEKQGIVISDTMQPESPADLFRAKVCRRDMGYPHVTPAVISVCVYAIGEAHGSADVLTSLLGCSEVLNVQRITNSHEIDPQSVCVVVVPDYLEPGLAEFGRLVFKEGIRFIPVKPGGVVPWIGPIFIPGETGCIECLLVRVRGHRRPEVEQIGKNGGSESLHLSVGQTIHSLAMVSSLLAMELEKLALGGTPEVTGTVFTFDCQSLSLDRHSVVRRPQCSLCGTLFSESVLFPAIDEIMPKKPLMLQSQMKTDYSDGGERVCAAMETLERYSHLVSPVTGIVGQITTLRDIPSCFGAVTMSTWIVFDTGRKDRSEESGRSAATGLSTGKGRTAPQARVSALGEAVERYCAQYEGCEHRIRASFFELGDVAIHPYDLMGYSEKQYREREVWCQKSDVSYVPDRYDSNRPIDWTPAWSLTYRKWKFIPSAFVYYSYPQEGGGDICRGCSNGVAAGNCLEEAAMLGFYELIERDAVSMWWYHRLRKPAVDWLSFGSPFVSSVAAAMDEMKMSLEILDLTNDFGIPVFSANLFNDETGGRLTSIGLGCHDDPLIALERALSELGQCWRLSGREKNSIAFQESPCSLAPYLRADPRQTPKQPSNFSREQRADFLNDIEHSVQLLRAHQLEMLIVDLTRPDVAFPVVRVVVPGIVHFWPRFGCRRLFEVPREAGWIDDQTGEDDLNPTPFFL